MKKNKKTLLLVREQDKLMKKVMEYNFKDAEVRVIPESYTPFDREDLATEINNNYENLILYSYYDQFNELLPLIKKTVHRKWIVDFSVSALSISYIFQNLTLLLEYQDRGLIDTIASIQYSLYATFKDRMKYIVLDYEDNNKDKKEDRIGILNKDYEDIANFYNEISGVAISSIKKARVLNAINPTLAFSKDFNVELEIEKDIEKLVYGNKVNLDVEFSDISPITFIMSMDAGIPCILGNTPLLANSELEDMLVVDSDDDVEEIKDKIEYALENTDKIMKKYEKWRADYKKLSSKTIEEFMK